MSFFSDGSGISSVFSLFLDATARTANSITTRELDESLNEWKLHYVIGQVNSLMSYENESMRLINDVEAMIENMKEYAVNRELFAKLNDSIKVRRSILTKIMTLQPYHRHTVTVPYRNVPYRNVPQRAVLEPYRTVLEPYRTVT